MAFLRKKTKLRKGTYWKKEKACVPSGLNSMWPKSSVMIDRSGDFKEKKIKKNPLFPEFFKCRHWDLIF